LKERKAMNIPLNLFQNKADNDILAQWILERWYGVMWNGFVWLRKGTRGEFL
jgi:hypothetical protein